MHKENGQADVEQDDHADHDCVWALVKTQGDEVQCHQICVVDTENEIQNVFQVCPINCYCDKNIIFLYYCQKSFFFNVFNLVSVTYKVNQSDLLVLVDHGSSSSPKASNRCKKRHEINCDILRC